MTKSKIDKLEEQKNKLEKEIIDLKHNQRWKCPNCKKSTKIKELTVIQSMHYNYCWEDWFYDDENFITCLLCNKTHRHFSLGDTKLHNFVMENRSYFGKWETRESGKIIFDTQ